MRSLGCEAIMLSSQPLTVTPTLPLAEVLRDHFVERPHSRVIIFVAYRTTVSALCAHLRADPAVTFPLRHCIHHERAPSVPLSQSLSTALDLTPVPISSAQLSGLVRAAP